MQRKVILIGVKTATVEEVIGQINLVMFEDQKVKNTNEHMADQMIEEWMVEMGVLGFQAEDGIRHWSATGVQTCALPI